MRVQLFGKKDCKLCEAAKEKLRLLDVGYEYIPMAEVLSGECRSLGALVQWAHTDGALPIIVIDDEGYSYSGAMKKLKRMLKDRR